MPNLTLGQRSNGQIIHPSVGDNHMQTILESGTYTAGTTINVVNPGWEWLTMVWHLTTGGAIAETHTMRCYAWLEAEQSYASTLTANSIFATAFTMEDTETDGNNKKCHIGPGALASTWRATSVAGHGPLPARFRLLITSSGSAALVYSISAHMGMGIMDST